MTNIPKKQTFYFSWTNDVDEFSRYRIYNRCSFRFKNCYIHWFKIKSFSLTINYLPKNETLDNELFNRVIDYVLKIMKQYGYEKAKHIKNPA